MSTFTPRNAMRYTFPPFCSCYIFIHFHKTTFVHCIATTWVVEGPRRSQKAKIDPDGPGRARIGPDRPRKAQIDPDRPRKAQTAQKAPEDPRRPRWVQIGPDEPG